jgi:hypothetical protein
MKLVKLGELIKNVLVMDITSIFVLKKPKQEINVREKV